MSVGSTKSGAFALLLSPDFKFVNNFKKMGNASTVNVTFHALNNKRRTLSPQLRATFKIDIKAIMSLFFAWNDML
jgi:hypothetical protein